MALADPLGGKGYANVLAPVKIPDFSNIAAMQTANNQLALQAARLGAEQKAKADALALAQAKAQKEAADKEAAAKAKQQADNLVILKNDTDPLMGDAQSWARDAYTKLQDRATDLENRGIALNGADKEAAQFRMDMDTYHTNYKRHSEVAKSYKTLYAKWAENPDAYEPFDLASRVKNYNTTSGWDKEAYPESLVPIVGVATADKVAKYEDGMLGESEYSKDLSKKAKGYIGNDPIREKTESYMVRDFQGLADDVNKNLRHSSDKDQRGLYKFYQQQAAAVGQIDEEGNIMPEYFANREKVTRKKGGTEDAIISQPEPRVEKSDGSDLNQNSSGQWTFGNKASAVKYVPTPQGGIYNIATSLWGKLQEGQEATNKMGDNLMNKYHPEQKAQYEREKTANSIPSPVVVQPSGNVLLSQVPDDQWIKVEGGKVKKGTPPPEKLKISSSPAMFQYFPARKDEQGNIIPVTSEQMGVGQDAFSSPVVEGFAPFKTHTEGDQTYMVYAPTLMAADNYRDALSKQEVAKMIGADVKKEQQQKVQAQVPKQDAPLSGIKITRPNK